MKIRNIIFLLTAFMMIGGAIPQRSSADDDRHYDRRDDRRDSWWDNTWGRGRSQVSDRRDLEGTWYLNGDSNKRAQINSSRDGLQARNEQGQATRLELSRNGDIRALDWEHGLRGDVRRDRIEWENGTTWTREPRDKRR